MRIVYFTDILLTINGISSSIISLSRAMKKRGHEMFIFAPKPDRSKNNLDFSDLNVDFFPSFGSSFNPDLRISAPMSPKLIDTVKSFNPDIIHFHVPFLAGSNALLLSKILKKPVVGTFHSYFMEPEYLKRTGVHNGSKMLTNFLWTYVVFFYNQCDVIVAPAPLVKKDLIKHGVKKPVYIISNLVDETKFKVVDKITLNKLRSNYSLSQKVVLYVGRLSHEKNIDILIKSFARVLNKIPDANLLLIGDGDVRKQLVMLCKKLQIQKKVIFTGAIKQDRLLSKGYLQLGSLFATASTSEAQPVSLIEAMYFGLPIVGVAKRGVLDVVKGVGLLSQPNNITELSKNTQRVLTDNKLRHKLSKNSKKIFLNKHSTKNIVSQFENLYESLIKS